MAEDPIAAEKFKAWSRRKAVRDRGLNLIGQLSSNRLGDETKFKDATISMCAVDKLLQDSAGDFGEENRKPATVKEATIKSTWLKWTIEHKYKFSRVQLSDQEYKDFSGAVKEFMDEEVDPGTDKKKYYLASLQYDVPAKPKPGEKPKPQTPDQRLKCRIYMRESNKFWKSCQQELDKRLTEYLARAATSFGAGGGESKEESKGGESKGGDDAPTDGNDFNFGSNQLRTESAFLSKNGIGQMKRWLEEDQDEAIEKEKKEKNEAAEEARKEHEQWVKKKDSLRIRLPTSDQLAKVLPKPASRMGYGGEMNAVRPAHAGGAKSTIEIMARSGLKYIHATNKGRQGNEGDFEAGRKLLAQIEDQEAKSLQQEAESKQRSEKAYEQWTLQKDMRDQALKLLPLIEMPGIEMTKNSIPSLSMKASVSKLGGSKSGASVMGSLNGPLKPKDVDVALCLEVGRNLKKVDRALFQEWYKWCNGIINFNHAITIWDFFDPRACDVHSATYSQVRDTFQKLLRPGVDYTQAFKTYAAKLVKKAAALAESKSENQDVDANNIVLNKRDMKKFLRSLGFEMKATELRVLIDAFDANGDGSVSIREFSDFVGPKREKKGGISTILGQRCCFQTTCTKTGMANAYSISIVPKKFDSNSALIAESKGGDDRLEAQDEKEEDRIMTEGVSRTEKVMPNGETRVRVELKERVKREAILKKYNLIKPSSRNSTKAESKDTQDYDTYREEDDEEYGDSEFHDPKDENGDNDSKDAKDESKFERCSFIELTLEHRRVGLKYLMDKTKESRQEQLIKNLMSNGTPPAAPKLWCASCDDPNELQLKWGPDQQADLVSFYSLEFAGAVGSSNSKPQEYREIFRDPADASPDSKFELTSIVDKLEPGKSYFFRIRGFNGFGPGPFTYKEFSTAPAPPATPRIIKLSSCSVTLRWTFTPSFFKCLEELRRIFDAADTDGTGTVERNELSAILTDKAPSSGNITSFLKKVETSAGISFEYGYDALFDLIESDDDGHLSWDEFEKFFLNVGWSGGTGGGSVAASRASMSGSSKASSDGYTYIIEQCSSEFDDKYDEIMKTTAGECTIHRLDAGKSYRFRVFAINSSGISGAKSESVVVNTMVETPNAPTTINSAAAIGSKVISLSWKARNAFNSTRDEKVQKRMMGEWSGSGGDNEEGVSVEKAFMQYDRDGNESIDASELALLLQDLGVEATEERLRNAFDEFDKNGDGVISFEEFSEWWKKDEVEYVLKRSEPIFTVVDDNEAKATSSVVRKSATVSSIACPIVSYRGDRCKCDIMGLEPNRLYHFRLRYHGSRSNSQLSPPLALMTAPLPPPNAPVVIRKTATNAWIKWYSPVGGAYRFVVQLKPESVNSSMSIGTNKGGNTDKGGWSNVFNGPETSWKSTTMTPDTSYLLRVCGVNCQGTVGEPSPVLRFKTLPRGESSTLTPKTVQSDFRIECTGDICVGDTILITERLFEKTVNNTTQFLDTTGVRKSTQSGVAGSGGSNKGMVRLDMSVTSVGSMNGGNAQLGAYLGERTICAHVMKDNYRTLKKEERKGNLSVNDVTVGSSKFSKNRRLMLEVVWQRSSTDACRPYDLKPGVTVERHQAHLEQFEVFRCNWEQEEGRAPLAVDWNSLNDCFIGLSC